LDLELKDKVALVTGASRGIGRSIALRLAQEGMDLAVLARNEGQLRTLASQIEALGRRCLVYPADLTAENAPGGFIAASLAHFGHLDLLVNNAGATRRGDFLTLTEQEWSDGFALKFFGAVRLCRAAWPHLMARHGSIINIAGVGGRTGSAEFTIGGSVNAALLNLTKCLADRGIQDGIRVNAINPGAIRTDRLALRIQRFARENRISIEAAAAQMPRQMAIARFGEPEEIAAMVAFLASTHAAYCHGALIDIDGGLTRTL
jgi:NAD(P)-dependent dehydrogenase (short-subunit alcohol dehydrogenase family)